MSSNKYNLPKPFLKAIENDSYTKGEADFSATEIIDSPRISRMKHIYKDNIQKDYYDSIFPLLGTAIHHILEENKDEDDIAEERLYINVDGFVLSGQIDLQVKNGDEYLVHDYKTTSASTLTYNPDGKREWEEQLNIYATLVEQSTGRKVNGVGVWAIIRDWSKVQAGRKEGYPEAPVVLVEMSLWDAQERMDFIRSRVMKHSMVEGIDDESKLPECTKEERWAKDKTYAVYNFIANGSQRKRATRVFDTSDEALTFGKGKGDAYVIEERMGKNTRCESWCDFKEYCSQYKQIIEN